MKKAWRKSSEALIEKFSQLVPPDPRVERRQMFGYPAAFTGGNLFMSLFEESMIFRVAEPDRVQLLSVAGSRLFEPMPGRPMREYVVLPEVLIGDPEAARGWAARAFEYALSLPPKRSKAASTRKKTIGVKPSKSRATKPKRKARG